MGRENLLGEDEGDEVTNVHGLRGWTSASVKIEGLLLLICVQHLMHVSAKTVIRGK